ncbi:MAG: nuclear transport factor 2 family protein [Bacteroidota bacterium]
MRKLFFLQIAFVILFASVTTSLSAQKPSEEDKIAITGALKTWNAAAKSANVDQCMALFDDSENIMLIGSDKGEVKKGKAQIRDWLTKIFGVASFSWEMDSINIDSNGKTAWVFVEGSMIVEFHKGGINRTPYRFTGILVKKKGEWKWRLFDGSIPKGE